MQADYRVDRLQIDENTGDVSIICWDNVYEEEFAKYLGNADEEWARDNAAAILDDSSFFMADEVKNELISTFGLEDYGHEIIDIEDMDTEDISFDDIDDDASLLDDEYERPVEEEDFDEESLNYEDETNESFDLREALNKIDLNTDNHYDLLNLYESCNLTESEKHKLATIVYDDAQPNMIYDALNRKYLNDESLDDTLEEAVPAALMALGTAAAGGFGSALGDKIGSKLFGENIDELEEGWEPTFGDEWRPEDIEKWKSIDWKARNYDKFIDDSDTFEHDVVAYGLPGGEQHATAVFAKEFSANPIFPPAWKPINDPFEGKGTNGWYMYDGRAHDDGYLIHDRTETQEVSDALSESRMDEGVLDKIKGYGKDLVKGIASQAGTIAKNAAGMAKQAVDNKRGNDLQNSVGGDIFTLAKGAGAEVTTTSDNKSTIIQLPDNMNANDKKALLDAINETGIKYDKNLAAKGMIQIPTSEVKKAQKVINKDKKMQLKADNKQAKAQQDLKNMFSQAGITKLSQLKDLGILSESLDNEFTFRETKSVLDSDGFITDYTWYECADGTHVFVFGDTDVYGPEDGYFDHECDSEAEAREWFDSYNGFDEDELNESKSIKESPDANIGYNPEYYNYIEEVAQRFEAGEYDDAYEVCEYVANKFNKDINTVREDINKLIRDSKSIREDIDVQYAIDWYVDSGAADEEAEEYCPENPDDWNVDNPYFEDRALSWFETSPYNHIIDDEYDWEYDLDESKSIKESAELSTEHAIESVVDKIKQVYEMGGFDKLPTGRENAVTIEIYGPDKSRLTGYFKSKPEFNHEINGENDIISNEFISDKYDIEIFDSFIQMYKIPQNESLDENILEEATLKDKVNAALARYDFNED